MSRQLYNAEEAIIKHIITSQTDLFVLLWPKSRGLGNKCLIVTHETLYVTLRKVPKFKLWWFMVSLCFYLVHSFTGAATMAELVTLFHVHNYMPNAAN